MKKTFSLILIGYIFLGVGTIWSIYNLILSTFKYGFSDLTTIIVAFAIITYLFPIIVIPFILDRIFKHKYINKIMLSLFLIVLPTVWWLSYISNVTTDLPNYLLLSKFGLINTYITLFINPSMLISIGAIFFVIGGIRLLKEKL